MALYDKIGDGYDISRKADPYISSRLLFHLKTKKGAKYIDLACGTGNYTLALKQLGVQICGIDNSKDMLEIARRKNASVDWHLGNVEVLPFADGSFSGATCVLAIHHFNNLQRVFNEAARVISDGRFVIFTATFEQMKTYWLNEYFPIALKRSIDQMPSKRNIIETLQNTGFREIYSEIYNIRHDLRDFFLYSGKRKPEIYLDSKVRKGISTFSNLAEPDEIIKGCKKLEEDIHSGRITQVMNTYDIAKGGDYLFIVGSKL